MTNLEIRQDLAKTIAEAVANGCPPWRQPWGNKSADKPGIPMQLPRNFLTGRRYSGLNPLIMMNSCRIHGFQSPYWGSLNQWSTIGAYVKPRPEFIPNGAWATSIVFYTQVEKDKPVEAGETHGDDEKERFMVMRRYNVFNAEQIAPPDVEWLMAATLKAQQAFALKVLGKKIKKMTRKLAESINKAVEEKLNKFRVILSDTTDTVDGPSEYLAAEKLLTTTGAKFKYGGNRAFYHTSGDYIQLPHSKTFDSLAAFYETAYHELMHWCAQHTGKSNALGLVGKDKIYAFNELVAEIGACFLASETGLPIYRDMLPRSQSYISHWLSNIDGDPQYIFKAATLAGQLVDFVLGYGL